MTQDEKSLLKNGLLGAVVVAGFWFLVNAIHSRIVTVIALIVWGAVFWVIFYRDAQKKGPN